MYKRQVSIGAQYFDEIREDDCFYIDKTGFIKEWWENKDKVTLITRARRFAKTLAVSMPGLLLFSEACRQGGSV